MQLTTRPVFKQRVTTRLGKIDSPKLAPTQQVIEQAVEDALDEFTKLRPRVQTFQTAGDDSKKRYVLRTFVTGWRNGSSKISRVEEVISADTDDEQITGFDDADILLSIDTSGDDILRLPHTISASNVIRIVWEDRHIIHESDETLTTVAEAHTEVVTLFAVAMLERWVARKASELSDASLGASQVDLESVATRFRERATEDLRAALERLGPASADASYYDWESESGLTGTRRISHP